MRRVQPFLNRGCVGSFIKRFAFASEIAFPNCSLFSPRAFFRMDALAAKQRLAVFAHRAMTVAPRPPFCEDTGVAIIGTPARKTAISRSPPAHLISGKRRSCATCVVATFTARHHYECHSHVRLALQINHVRCAGGCCGGTRRGTRSRRRAWC